MSSGYRYDFSLTKNALLIKATPPSRIKGYFDSYIAEKELRIAEEAARREFGV